jgi:hypothetical protein
MYSRNHLQSRRIGSTRLFGCCRHSIWSSSMSVSTKYQRPWHSVNIRPYPKTRHNDLSLITHGSYLYSKMTLCSMGEFVSSCPAQISLSLRETICKAVVVDDGHRVGPTGCTSVYTRAQAVHSQTSARDTASIKALHLYTIPF